MSPREFFKAVLPSSGRYCVASIRPGEKFARQRFTQDFEHLIKLATYIPEGSNAYFACSTFGDKTNKKGRIARSQHNTILTKSLWFDLDLDPEDPKKYASQAEALLALRDFCAQLKLPRPLLVNSGAGIHAYWPLVEECEYEVWFPVASRLKLVGLKLGLKIDVKCTSDSARVLRIPGSINYNHGEPLETSFISASFRPISVTDMARKLAVIEVEEETIPERLPFSVPSYVKGLDDTTRALAGDYATSNFQVLYSKKQCAQIVHIVENQEEISEPLWRAGLSIAQACEDRETAIHFMSDKHPKYCETETKVKAKATVGPLTCDKFDEENPGVCGDCRWRGIIKSPIALGRQAEIDESPEPAIVVIPNEETNEETTYEIPVYPKPFIRAKDGAVAVRAPEEEGGSQIIYPHPFYIITRMRDPVEGEVLVARLHLPHDGVREFTISLKEVSATDRFRDAISVEGIVVNATALSSLRSYVMRWAQELQTQMKAQDMRNQNGWTPEDTFIIGDREIRTDGIYYSPPAREMVNICEMMGKKGTIEGWKRIANIYDHPGMESRAFVLFAGFGAPLMRFTELKGGMINLTSPTSGEGKTTLQEVINSIWGHPQRLKVERTDTNNARIHRMGVMNSLPVTIDEITNMPAMDASDFLYASTSGRGRDRMEGASNTIRHNNTTWSTLVITSANSSFEDKIRSLKASSEGELMRLMEIQVQRLYVGSKEETDALFASMKDNYGVVGEVYAQYLVRNVEEVKKLLSQVQKRIDARAGLTQKERVWSAMAATAITGGMIAKSLGLHDIDVTRVVNWVRDFLSTAKDSSKNSTEMLGSNALGTFLDSHHINTLIINNKNTSGVPMAPMAENHRELYVRIEPDTELVFITSARLRAWCAENQVPFNGLLNELKLLGLDVEHTTKRMSSGTAFPTSPVRAIKLHDPNKVLLDTETIARRPNLKVVGASDAKAAP